MRRALHARLRPRAARAFTLIEILIVVTILGILAGIASLMAASAVIDTRLTVFVADLRVLGDATMMHNAQEGLPVPEAAPGSLPPDLDPYLTQQDKFNAITPIGGEWDVTSDTLGVASAVGVVFTGAGPTRDDAFMARADAMLDDGDLTSGVFRKLDANAYYLIVKR